MRKISLSEFKEECNKIHNGKYNYDLVQFINIRDKIKITCPAHGLFLQVAWSHKFGYGCKKCSDLNNSKTKTIKYKENILDKFREIHGNKYDYSKFIYSSNKKKSIIICHKHGEFEQSPMDHLRKHGCKKCGQQHGRGGFFGGPGWYSNSILFEKYPDLGNKPCILYLVRLYDTKESFFKIGITTRTVSKRFLNKYGYTLDIILEQRGILSNLFRIEQKIIHSFSRFKYLPIHFKGGRNECFDINLPLSEIQEIIKGAC